MKNIVDFLKLPPRILGALSVASGLLLFLPNVIIEKLYMTSFRDKYGFAIGIVFVVSTSILVVFLVVIIAKKIKDKYYYTICFCRRNNSLGVCRHTSK